MTIKTLFLLATLSFHGCAHALSYEDQGEACTKVRDDSRIQRGFIQDFLQKCEEFCGELNHQVKEYYSYEARAERICPDHIQTLNYLDDLSRKVLEKNQECGCVPPEGLSLESRLENVAPPGASYKRLRRKN